MVEYATISMIGDKEINEDSVKVFINKPLFTYGFVLADGLGGHGNGDVASSFVTEFVGAAVENTDHFDGVFIDECFDVAQEMLLAEKERTGLSSIKTTMVLLLITQNTARWGHIGDSRLYHFRDGKQLSRTIDHSVPQMLVLSKQIKERDIRHHPDRSRLLSAMGAEWNGPAYEIDQREMRTLRGDSFLLCSDGFWEWIDEKTMIRLLKKGLSAHETLREMVVEIKRNAAGKKMDDHSAVLVNIK